MPDRTRNRKTRRGNYQVRDRSDLQQIDQRFRVVAAVVPQRIFDGFATALRRQSGSPHRSYKPKELVEFLFVAESRWNHTVIFSNGVHHLFAGC